MSARSHLPGWNYLVVILAAFVSVGAYLFFSQRFYGPGFPLDDAWIYQTYARNLAWRSEWAFLPGVPSGGSTGPLWSILLAPGYWLRLSPFFWTWLMGCLILAAVGVIGMWLFALSWPALKTSSIWVGLALVLEWHLVWAAGSGMETLAFSALVLFVLGLLLVIPHRARSWFWIGLLIGLSVWLRPEGVTLLGPAGLCVALAPKPRKQKLPYLLSLMAGFLLLFCAYLGFNWMVGGSWWPTTYYAKQEEYQALQSIPYLVRWLRLLALPLVGVGVVLLPGLGYGLWRAWHQRSWGIWVMAIWLLAYISVYAWRLPVDYQHGRYLIPAMLVYFWIACGGLLAWLSKLRQGRVEYLASRVWALTAVFVLLGFWGLGARAFANDVAVIESEMVAAARWVAEYTPEDALVAAHDIGALGYFGERDILDLAGLVSPAVIPFIRDQARLAAFLDQQGADYLMTFPDWYPELATQGHQLFSTQAPISPSLGGENMAVYRWPQP
ncbi:MAG: hypothetical protein JW862_04810 [Anaerolineales bacterium]|nr:hypothetical protein [Anaerolineales bacterium]